MRRIGMGNEPELIKCKYCENFYNEEDLTQYKVGGNEILLCRCCYDDDVKRCEECAGLEYKDDMVRSDITGDYFCHDCYDEIFTSCDDCGYEIYRDGDYGEFCEECDNNRYHDDDYDRWSRSWNYHGTDSTLFYGIELEVGSESYMGLKGMFVNNLDKDFFDIHSDCSITENDIADEAEIVSHPATYKYLKEHPELWNNVLRYRHKGVISYRTGTCGIHIHLSRDYFTTKHLERFLQMIYCQSSFTYFISQRNSGALSQWARLYDRYNDNKRYTKRAIKEKVQKDRYSHERYEAVNLSNTHTIELRLFRGTLNQTAFWKNIEYVQALVEFTKDANNKLTLSKFLNYIAENKDDYCNLQKWIVKRRATLVSDKEPVTFKKVKRILKHLELV